MREVLFSGRWGTISPKSVEAQAAIAEFMERKHGLCLHSANAALEALLRSLDIGYGDEVVVASYGNAMDSMAVSCIGAKPV
ncbi:MAG TPA: DegT/DnrJ/EryC1/StrS family aminotransferase, partial [Clostridia bacterium]|nr:DegT/DnrJ/EryC1/StrS family aminotransferase [Clostridia bacterium]